MFLNLIIFTIACQQMTCGFYHEHPLAFSFLSFLSEWHSFKKFYVFYRLIEWFEFEET